MRLDNTQSFTLCRKLNEFLECFLSLPNTLSCDHLDVPVHEFLHYLFLVFVNIFFGTNFLAAFKYKITNFVQMST